MGHPDRMQHPVGNRGFRDSEKQALKKNLNMGNSNSKPKGPAQTPPDPMSRTQQRKRKQAEMQQGMPQEDKVLKPSDSGNSSMEERKFRTAILSWRQKMKRENPHEPVLLAAALEDRSVSDAAKAVLDRAGATLEEWVMDKMGEGIELGLDEHDQVVV